MENITCEEFIKQELEKYIKQEQGKYNSEVPHIPLLEQGGIVIVPTYKDDNSKEKE